jgi:mannose-6-phosphate isomerase
MLALIEELSAAKLWLTDHALPFWSSAGFDRSAALFEERLDFTGEPVREAPHRLMVQCRQIYVFSHATLLGWFDGRALVEQSLMSLLRTYGSRIEGVPYVFSVSRAGEVIDARQDTYAYAFLLFAFAWAHRLLGDRMDPQFPSDLIIHLKAQLAHDSGAGFIDGLPRRDRNLRQNPQMHLFEALIEVDDAFGSAEARSLCRHIHHLFRDRLFLASERALPELHDDLWRPEGELDSPFEPGHHFEWIWLLSRHAARSGERVDDLVAALADRAYSEGIDHLGATIETVAIRGDRRVLSRRCWGTCEALKAATSDFENQRAPTVAVERATRFLRALRALFLAAPFPAGWLDRIDPQGKPLLNYVPASTLYHIFLAVAEADRVFGRARPRM